MSEEIPDAKQRIEARPITAGAQIAIMNEPGLSHRQAKENNRACRQWLVVVLVGQELQALVDIVSDLYLIWKDIAEYPHLQPFFPARAATQAGIIPFKT